MNNGNKKQKTGNKGFEQMLYENSILYEKKPKKNDNNGLFETSFKEALGNAIESVTTTTTTDARVSLDAVVRDNIETVVSPALSIKNEETKLEKRHYKAAHNLTEEIMLLIHTLLFVIEPEDRQDEYSNNLRKAIKDYIMTTIQENIHIVKNNLEDKKFKKVVEDSLNVYKDGTDKEYAYEEVYLMCLPLQEILEDDITYKKNKGIILKTLYLMSIKKKSKEEAIGELHFSNIKFDLSGIEHGATGP